MEEGTRRLRADAERNRQRLLDAATEVFCERGLDVGVAEIAQHAGVGRATLFRNFPTKQDLIAAIVVERMADTGRRARAKLDAEDPGEALFEVLEEAVGMSTTQTDRALFDALDDEFLSNEVIAAAHADLLEVLDGLVRRAQEAGEVRPDVTAIDVLVMVKGTCEACRSYQHVDPELALRQLDLVRAAISAPGVDRPLRGRRPTVDDFQRPGSAVA